MVEGDNEMFRGLRKVLSVMVIFLIALLWLFVARAFGQNIDEQNRDILHIQADVTRKCFVSAWLVENARLISPNNQNVWFGGGCGSSRRWLEVQTQKQWNSSGGFWAADQRYFQKLGTNWSLAVETTEIISKPGFYEFVVAERKLSSRWGLRLETENTHRLSKQVIAAGGGVSFSLADIDGWKLAPALVYRASPTGPDELRLYLGLSKRFSTGRGRH
jgi:hypothetical protein